MGIPEGNGRKVSGVEEAKFFRDSVVSSIRFVDPQARHRAEHILVLGLVRHQATALHVSPERC